MNINIRFDKEKDEICLVSYLGLDFNSIAIFPLGIASLSGTLKEAGYKVKILDLDINSKLENEISNYKIVMFSLVAGKALSFALNKIEELKAIDKTIVVGGPLVSAMPQRILKETKADYFVYGDVERSIVKLMQHVEGKGKLEDIKGVGYRKNGEIKINPPDIIEDLDNLAFPDLESFDVEAYTKHIEFRLGVKSINWYTSRGCAFDCQFCFHEKNFRGQSAGKILKDLKYMKEKYNISGFWFLDDNFMNNHKRVLEFCRLVKKEGLDIKWGCEARVTSVKEDIVREMKEAGCVAIRNGIESGSDRILKVMHKAATVKDIKEAVRILTKLDMPIKGGFMFGVPTETIEDAKETVKLIKWIYKMDPKANLWTYFYTPRPDTPWYYEAVKLGMKEFTLNDWTNLDKYNGLIYNLSNITEKQIKKLMRRVSFYKFLAVSRRKKYMNVPGVVTGYTFRRLNSLAKYIVGNNQVQALEGH